MGKPTSIGDVVIMVTTDTSTTVKKLRAFERHLGALADELEEIDREDAERKVGATIAEEVRAKRIVIE